MRFFKRILHYYMKWRSKPDVFVRIVHRLNHGSGNVIWSAVQSVLVVKLDEIGDFVLVTPFLRELRRNAPNAKIVLVVQPLVYNLAETCPFVDKVLTYNWNITGWLVILRGRWQALRLALEQLRSWRFEVAVIPRWDADTYGATQLAIYSGARSLVAYSEECTATKRAANPGYDRLVSHVIGADVHKGHEVRASLLLLETFGGRILSSEPELWLTEADKSFAQLYLPSGRAYVAIATGASKPEKCWPADRFEQLAAWLAGTRGLTPVLLGMSGDPLIAGAINLLGQTTLRQAAALLIRCSLFVGNDSGLKHMAAAVKTPVVEVNALRLGKMSVHPNSPVRFCACSVEQRIVRPPAGLNDLAIKEIALDEVANAILSLLNEQG